MRYALGLSMMMFGALMVYSGFSNVPVGSLFTGIISGQTPEFKLNEPTYAKDGTWIPNPNAGESDNPTGGKDGTYYPPGTVPTQPLV